MRPHTCHPHMLWGARGWQRSRLDDLVLLGCCMRPNTCQACTFVQPASRATCMLHCPSARAVYLPRAPLVLCPPCRTLWERDLITDELEHLMHDFEGIAEVRSSSALLSVCWQGCSMCGNWHCIGPASGGGGGLWQRAPCTAWPGPPHSSLFSEMELS